MNELLGALLFPRVRYFTSYTTQSQWRSRTSLVPGTRSTRTSQVLYAAPHSGRTMNKVLPNPFLPLALSPACSCDFAPVKALLSLLADSPSAPVNVTVKHLKANSAVVTWDVLEDEVVIGFAISQQKKDVRMLRFIQEVNTTTRSCALWDLEEDTEYIVHVQSISIQGQSPASEPVLFKTPREAEKLASKNKGKCG
ncbi:fibronectin type III domain-containing protein 5 isoform X2 [Cuculus canorus]|uniref:fibronectin type III domain-containing protein 5 isoform X2 n=1 Tax=Cuculus canorus TaxID=55661 RepID=UPI0023AA3F73|nr:fibronectin type III domain-containing protein 5 isoform X2 [Cuculus canorus]